MKHIDIIFGALFASGALAYSQTTAFTYQGRLSDNGGAANGVYELRFLLHSAASGNAPIGPALDATNVSVSAGNFAVMLDFGGGVFTGPARWLEIAVRTNGSLAPHAVLAPRQLLTPSPYATYAGSASNLLGTVSDAQLSTNIVRLNANQNLTGAVVFNPLFGAPFAIGSTNTNKVAWLNADLLDGFDSAAFARSNHTHSALEVTGGTLSDARLSPNVALLNEHQAFSGSNTFTGVLGATNTSNMFAGTFSGNGSGLTGLNAAALGGSIPIASLPLSVSQLGSNQTFTGVVTFSPATGAPLRVNSSTLVTNLNADLLDGVGASAFWNVGGNVGTTSANFIGTTDNQSFELRVNNSRALRITPTVSAANIVAGAFNNAVGANVLGGVVGGGSANTVTGNFAVVIGGQNNSATNFAASVLGGSGNIAGGQNSVAAGRNARATHDSTLVWADGSTAAAFTSAAPNTVLFRATGGIGIGTNTPASALHVVGTVQSDNLRVTGGASAGAVLVSDAGGNAGWQPPATRAQTNGNSPNIIGGHLANTIAGGVVGATISGGGSPSASNYISGNYGTVAGGAGNRVTGTLGTVGGGTNNLATNNAVVGGGLFNSAGDSAAIGGGSLNNASGFGAFIGGGTLNTASGSESAVVGGFTNRAGGLRSFVGGGTLNFADGTRSTIAGGDNNRATNSFGSIGGGIANTNYGLAATISGGQNNAVTGFAATIPGGSGNVAGGQYSFAAGRNARALHDGAFVWSDSFSATPFSSTANDQFLIRANGGVGIGGAPVDAMLDVEGAVRLNDNDVFLRSGTDRNHGLGWYSSSKPFNLWALDGPVLYGWAGGGLATTAGGQQMVLSWNSSGRVAIGSNAPSNPLTVETAGTDVGGGAGFPEVVARFKNTLAQQSAIAIDAGAGRESVLFLSQNAAPWWSVRNNGTTHNLQFHYHGAGAANSVFAAFNTNGLFGIGTTVPTEQFHVSSGNQTIGLFQNGRTDGAWLAIENNGGGRRWNLISTGTANGEGAGHLLFYAGGASPAQRMIIRGSDGNVGIGTTSPADRLTVVGGIKVDDADQNNGTYLNGIRFGANNTGEAIGSRRQAGANQYGLDFYTGYVNRMSIANGSGNVGIGTASPAEKLHVAGNYIRVDGGANEQVYMGGDGIANDAQFGSLNASVTDAGFWNPTRGECMNLSAKAFITCSDRNMKDITADISPRDVLARLIELPIQRWRYKSETNSEHIGPMAQDFYAAFQTGKDDKHIATVDADGVAFAAIQGLHALVKEKDKRIGQLEDRVSALEETVKERRALENKIASLENQLNALLRKPKDTKVVLVTNPRTADDVER